jgi:hypothetical protein
LFRHGKQKNSTGRAWRGKSHHPQAETYVIRFFAPVKNWKTDTSYPVIRSREILSIRDIYSLTRCRNPAGTYSKRRTHIGTKMEKPREKQDHRVNG